MNILIQAGRVMDPASGRDEVCDVAISASRILKIGQIPADFQADRVLDASGCWVLPGLVDLCARLGEPGQEHAHTLESELTAAVTGGVTSLVCPPDTDPVLDEPGLVEMLKTRSARFHQARVFPQGALTRQLAGKQLAEMFQLTQAGCVAFGQAEQAIEDTRVLQRALQYAATFGYKVWLRPVEPWLGTGVAASGALAMRMGLSGIPVASETIALNRIFALLEAVQQDDEQNFGVHICRLSSAAGVALLRQAKAQGLPVSADVSIHNLLLSDDDLGFFDARMRLTPPLRQNADRQALSDALADGTIDALVSDHSLVFEDQKQLPFAEAEPGASGLELLLPLALQWARERGESSLPRAVAALTSAPAQALGASLGTFAASCGRLREGGMADICVFDPAPVWTVQELSLRSQFKSTPFAGRQLQGRVRWTLVGSYLAHDAEVCAQEKA